jgi:CBS domain-containing protein
MAQHDIGALLVMEDGKPVGIFSERDFARKGILPGMDAKATPVRKMMSDKLICVTLTETVEDCMAIMTDRHIRHLPVLAEDGSVAGFLSIGDLVKETISEQTFIIGQLEHYISH